MMVMDYKDFWDISQYLNQELKGKLSNKDIAYTAYVFYDDYMQSLKRGKATGTLIQLLGRLRELNTEETQDWLETILLGVKE